MPFLLTEIFPISHELENKEVNKHFRGPFNKKKMNRNNHFSNVENKHHRNIQCYKCNEYGHKANQCKKQKVN